MERLVARDPQAITHAVVESCRIKAEIVAADERETGERALLNFGHTFGHAIETATGYGTWLHGEAVAAGMVLASRLSVLASGLPSREAERVVQLVRRAGLPIEPPSLELTTWLESMARDKKVESGAVRFVLLESLGRAAIRSGVAAEKVAASLKG